MNYIKLISLSFIGGMVLFGVLEVRAMNNAEEADLRVVTQNCLTVVQERHNHLDILKQRERQYFRKGLILFGVGALEVGYGMQKRGRVEYISTSSLVMTIGITWMVPKIIATIDENKSDFVKILREGL